MAPHKKKHHGSRRRNAADDDIPDDILLTPAPILLPQGTQLPMGMTRRPSKAGRAARAVRRRLSPMAPQAAKITKEHLVGVGANAAGGIATALAASELVDNIGVMPMAIGATVVGGIGSTFLSGHWQRIAQGVLGAGVGQLGTAYLTERALKKAAAAQKPPSPVVPNAPAFGAAAGKRNAYLPADDDDDLVRAMERNERRLGALLAEDDERNAYGDGGIEAEEVYGWGV